MVLLIKHWLSSHRANSDVLGRKALIFTAEALEYQSSSIMEDEISCLRPYQSHSCHFFSLDKPHRPNIRCSPEDEHWRASLDARKRREGILSIVQESVQPQPIVTS